MRPSVHAAVPQAVAVSLHRWHRDKERNVGRPPSTRHYVDDAAIDDGYESQWIDPGALAIHIGTGVAWVGCLLAAHPCGSEGSWRHADAAGTSNVVAFDFDGDLPLQTFWDNARLRQHCLFTYTTCSHGAKAAKVTSDRFRALFLVPSHPAADHPYIYQALWEYLGIEDLIPTKEQRKQNGWGAFDHSGSQAERLWYGNSKAVVHWGDNAPLDWERLLQRAEELRAAHTEQEATLRESSAQDPLDPQRAAWILRNVLRPSEDEEYQTYWQPIFMAASSDEAGDEVWDAFIEWHEQGHHVRRNPTRGLARRRHRAGQRSGLGAIFAFAKGRERHGEKHDHWWRNELKGSAPSWVRLLPEFLRFGAGAPPEIRSISAPRPMSGPEGGPFPLSPRIPDTIPSWLSADRHPTPEGEPAPAVVSVSAARPETRGQEAQSAKATISELLRRLYYIRCYRQIRAGDQLLENPTPSDFRDAEREILCQLAEVQYYRLNEEALELELLQMFREEFAFPSESQSWMDVNMRQHPGQAVQWLVPGWIMVGRVHVLYSSPGVGKTILCLNLARALVADPEAREFLDSGPINRPRDWRTCRVIFIETDMGFGAEEDIKSYLDAQGLANKPFLDYVTFKLPNPKAGDKGWKLRLWDIHRLIRQIEEAQASGCPIKAIILDAMKACVPGHLRVGDQAFRHYVDLVDEIAYRYNVAIIWIHHAGADGRAQGIQLITENPSMVAHLEKSKERRAVTIDIKKIRGGGHARRLEVDLFSPTGMTLLNSTSDDDEDDASAQRADSVLTVLRDHLAEFQQTHPTVSGTTLSQHYQGLSSGAILTRLEQPRYSSLTPLSPKTIRTTLETMRLEHRIEMRGHGRSTTYRIALSDGVDEQGSIIGF